MSSSVTANPEATVILTSVVQKVLPLPVLSPGMNMSWEKVLLKIVWGLPTALSAAISPGSSNPLVVQFRLVLTLLEPPIVLLLKSVEARTAACAEPMRLIGIRADMNEKAVIFMILRTSLLCFEHIAGQNDEIVWAENSSAFQVEAAD
jgi:hypothetical protein